MAHTLRSVRLQRLVALSSEQSASWLDLSSEKCKARSVIEARSASVIPHRIEDRNIGPIVMKNRRGAKVIACGFCSSKRAHRPLYAASEASKALPWQAELEQRGTKKGPELIVRRVTHFCSKFWPAVADLLRCLEGDQSAISRSFNEAEARQGMGTIDAVRLE